MLLPHSLPAEPAPAAPGRVAGAQQQVRSAEHRALKPARDRADQASIRVQFFIGQINLYCHARNLSTANFGQVIESNQDLKTALISAFSEGLTLGDLQEKLIEFIQSNYDRFQLEEPLTPENIKDIVSRFNVNFNTVLGSQHFDEFVCLDTTPLVEGVASVYRYAGQMSLDFSAVAKRMKVAIPSNIDLPATTLTTLLEKRQDLTLDEAQEQSQPRQLKVQNTINPIEYSDEFLMHQLEMFKSRSDFKSCALLLIRKIEGCDQYLFELPAYSGLDAEQVQEISSFIPEGLRPRFNAAVRINSMHLNADQVRSLYNVLMQEHPNAQLDYRTTESVKNLLNRLELHDLEVNVSPLGGFVVQVEEQAMIDTIQDKLSGPTNDHYLSTYMASQLYQAVADSEQCTPEQYKELMRLNNNDSPPVKINRALSLLGINGVQADSYGFNGYVIRGIDHAQINAIEQACQVRRLTTEAAAALYRAVRAQCNDTAVEAMNGLNNDTRPEKLERAMQLLELNFRKIVPNMYADQKNGYWINCSFDTYEAIQRIGTEYPAPVEAVTMAQHPRGAAPAQPTRFRGRDGGGHVNDQAYALTGTEQPEPAPEPEIQAVDQQHDFQLEVVKSYSIQALSTTRAPQSQYAAQLHGSTDILGAFQSMMQGSTLLGTTFHNPYLNILENFPESAEDLTLRHLHLLARNERINTTGAIKQALYGEHLTHDQISRIRCLVKFTTGSAIVYRNAHGGFRSERTVYGDEARPCIVVDQSGFQWQRDFKNTGALCIYLNEFLGAQDQAIGAQDQAIGAQDQPSRGLGSRLLTGVLSTIMGYGRETTAPAQAAQILEEVGVGVDLMNYTEFQQAMFRSIFSEDRPERPSQNSIQVQWNGHPAHLDLNLLSRGICLEMLQAIQAVSQTPSLSEVLEDNQKVHFKFLKAGMGYFADGLTADSIIHTLENARLEGIALALESLASGVGDPSMLTHIGKISLPFSGDECARNPEIRQRIESAMDRLGIVYGGTHNQDALDQGDEDIDPSTQIQYLLATSNCGDPHALCGNEGGHRSVDASIGTNANLDTLNSGYNSVIHCRPYQASDLQLAALCEMPNLEGTLIAQFNLIKDQLVDDDDKEPIVPPLAALEPEPEDAQTVVQGSKIKPGTWVRLNDTDSHPNLGSILEVGCSQQSRRQAFASNRYQIEIDGHALTILDKRDSYSEVTNPQDKSSILNALSEKMQIICAAVAHEQGPVSDASIAGEGAINADELSSQGAAVDFRSNRLSGSLDPSEQQRPPSPRD